MSGRVLETMTIAPQGTNGSGRGPATLVIPFAWVGDVVKAHSVVRLLAERHPDRPIDLLVPQRFAPLVAAMPHVRNAIAADLPRGRLALRARLALARRLRVERYEQAIVLPGTFKVALIPALAGIPRRTGWIGEWRVGLINDMRFGERNVSINERMLRLALGRHEAPPAAWPAPVLRVSHERLTAWRAREGLDSERPVLAIAPGSTAPARRWPLERFEALARRATDHGLDVFVLGGAAERATAQAITAAAGPRSRDYTGTPLDEAMLQARAARVVLANDSGLIHVAAAVGTPVVGIFGASNPAASGPIGPTALEVVEISLPCRPCDATHCPLGHHGCMTGIPVDAAFAAVERALAAGGR